MFEVMESRKRTTNFSTKEELLLISLVHKYRNKIECKKTDTMTNKSKLAAWNELAKEYNSTNGETYRDMRILKSKYENLKKTSKKRYAEEKSYATGAGGGPPTNSKVTIIDEQIKELLGDQVSGFPSEFEGDSENNPTDMALQGSSNEITPVVQSRDRSDYTPNMLCTPKAVPLRNSTNSQVISMEPLPQLPINIIFDPLDEMNPEDNDSVVLQGSSNEITSVVQSRDWSDYTPNLLRTPKAVPLRRNRINSQRKDSAQSKDKITKWVSAKMQLTEMQTLCLEKESLKRIQIMEQEAAKKLEYMEKEHLLRMDILACELQTKKNLLVLPK